MENARGLLPETRLNVSSTAGAAAGAVGPEPRLRELAAEPELPRERRPPEAGPEGRWVGGRGKEE